MEKTFSIQRLDEETRRWIGREAARRQIGMEDLVAELIRKGMEVDRASSQSTVFHDLDDLAGTWTEAETKEFLEATAFFDKVDDSIWE